MQPLGLHDGGEPRPSTSSSFDRRRRPCAGRSIRAYSSEGHGGRAAGSKSASRPLPRTTPDPDGRRPGDVQASRRAPPSGLIKRARRWHSKSSARGRASARRPRVPRQRAQPCPRSGRRCARAESGVRNSRPRSPRRPDEQRKTPGQHVQARVQRLGRELSGEALGGTLGSCSPRQVASRSSAASSPFRRAIAAGRRRRGRPSSGGGDPSRRLGRTAPEAVAWHAP